MNLDRPNSASVNGMPQQALANGSPTDLQNHEPALVRLYEELTGEDESQARNTFMFVIRDNLTTR
jgi:hypothetical protein